MSVFQKVLDVSNAVRDNDTKESEIERKRLEWIESLKNDAQAADLMISAETNGRLRKRLIKRGVL